MTGLRGSIAEALLLGAVVAAPLAFGSVELWAWTAVSCAVFAACVLCAAAPQYASERAGYRTFLPVIGALMLAALFQRLSPRTILEPSSILMTADPNATSVALQRWAAYAALFWCVPRVFHAPSGVRRLMGAIFLSGALVALVGIIQHAQNKHLLYGWRAISGNFDPFGPYFNRDHAGAMLVMSAICGGGLFWDAQSRWLAGRQSTGSSDFAARQAVLLFGVALICAGLVRALSRGAVGSLLVSCLVTAFLAAPSRRLWTVLAAAAAACALVATPLAERLTPSSIESALSFRWGLYSAGLELVADFPWLGVGLGAFGAAFQGYAPGSIGLVQHAHNDWLQLAAETGLIVAGVFMAGLAAFLRACVRTRSPLSWSLLAAAGAFLFHGLWDFNLQIPANGLLFFGLLGCLDSLTAPPERRKLLPGKPLLAAGLAALALALTVLTAPSAVASWHFMRERPALAAAHDRSGRYSHELAKALLAEGRLREGLRHNQAALVADPANPAFRALQARLLAGLGRLADSEAIWRRS